MYRYIINTMDIDKDITTNPKKLKLITLFTDF